jgi:excisionase family DNA binding protein
MGGTRQFNPNDVLTTGEVARLCNVAPRTVSKWFDTGQLRGYRIPGSKDRRIPIQQLVRFMRANGIPLGDLDAGQTRTLLVDDDLELLGLLEQALVRTERYSIKTATSGFEAGAMTERFKPHVILVDVTLPDIDPARMCRFVHAHEDLQATKIIATSGALTDGEIESLLREGVDTCLRKPFDVRQVMLAIEDAAAIVR